MGEHQEIETSINEEALLLAMFLRSERQAWAPRIANIQYGSYVTAERALSISSLQYRKV
jgi:hypothetical protein